MKSNAAAAVLLFLLCGFQTHASWPVSDTIIIDGETIYIEREVERTNLDSLQEEAKDDVKTKRVSQHRLSIQVNAGLNETFATYSTSVSDKVPLDIFMRKEKSTIVNPRLSIEAGYRLKRILVGANNLDISLHSGFGYNQIRVESVQFADENLLLQDSIIGLNYADDEIRLQYFLIADTMAGGIIIGEPKTLVIPVKKSLTKISTLDIPFSLRTTLNTGKSGLSVFLEAGVVARIPLKSGVQKADNFLINNKAEYEKLPAAEFEVKQLIRPVFSAGVGYKLPSAADDKGNFWTLGLQLTAYTPPTALNSGSLYYFNVWSASASLFVRYVF